MKKILPKFFGSCLFIGFMMILGTAGSSDLGLIDMRTILIQGGAGALIAAIGYFGLKAIGGGYVY